MSTARGEARREEFRSRTRRDYRRKRLIKSELTLDWARSNVVLTERKKKILEILEKRKMLTIEQLEYFHPDFGHQAKSLALLREDINKLFAVHLVDKALKKSVTQWDGTVKKTEVVAVGEIGSKYVGWRKHHKRIKYRDGEVVLSDTAHHILRVHDAEIQTRELVKKMNIEVKAWVFECRNKVVNHPNGLNPDAFCMLLDKETNQYYTFFFEYDTGKDDFNYRKKFPSLTEKIERYKEVKSWFKWYEKELSKASENKFPYIFFVTEEPKRFPELPKIFGRNELDHIVCMQSDYLSEFQKFIEQMRKKS